MFEYSLIVPTTKSKLPWLRRALFGFMSQMEPPSSILIGIDVKPWDVEPTNLGLDTSIRTLDFQPPRAFKRQHEIINTLLVHAVGAVCIMDDDYWPLTTACMGSMIAHAGEKKLVIPRSVLHSNQALPSTEPFVNGSIIDYGMEPKGNQVIVLDDGHGHNPFAGHPKIMMSEDFRKTGGFDWKTFSHYWWCDTDMWYRSRGALELIETDVAFMHLAHPKYKTELFQQQNSTAFLARHKDSLTPVHKRMLDSVIKP